MEKQVMGKVGLTREQILQNVFLRVEPEGTPEHEGNLVSHYLDLKIVYPIRLGECVTCKVNKKMLEVFNLTEFDIFSAARANTKAKLEIKSLTEILELAGFPSDAPSDVPIDCIRFKNEESFGASGICFAEIFKELCEKRGVGHCYILPSSIHEILVHYPMDTFATKENLDEMVQAVNAAEVAPEEVLADHCYVYELATNTITC